jgi:hypothetical protein
MSKYRENDINEVLKHESDSKYLKEKQAESKKTSEKAAIHEKSKKRKSVGDGFQEADQKNPKVEEQSAESSSKFDDEIKYKKLKEDDLGNRLVEKVRSDKAFLKEVRSNSPYRRTIEPKHIPNAKKVRGKVNRQKAFDERKQRLKEHEAVFLEKESHHIKETLKQGIRGESSPLYEDIKKNVLKEDKPLHKQLYSHEKGRQYADKAKQLKSKSEFSAKKADVTHGKIKSKKVIRVGEHEETVVDKQTGQTYSKLKHGIYMQDVKMRQGERTLNQKLNYQTLHQSKEVLKKDLEEAEQLEGNEGVQVAHRAETVLKDKIVKPYLRDNFGYDRHHVQERKLRHKAKVANAKESVNKEMSESLLESNPLSRAIQKRNVKKRIYQERGLYKSPWQKTKDVIGGMYRFADPFYKVKQTWHAISTAFSAMGFVIQSVLNSAMFIIVILIPIIAFVSIFSIFFGFGESPDVEIASMSRYWNEQLTDIRMEIIEADEAEHYSKSHYRPVDEVRIAGSVDINVVYEKARQVQVIGFVSALLQDNLSKSTGEDVLQVAFDELYKINQEHVDEGWWEEQIVGYEPYYPVLDSEGNISHYEGGEPIYEDVWVEYWVLYLSLEQGDINEYALNEFDQLDEEAKELALLQYEQYQEGLGYGQIGRNPFDETFDWRNNVSSLYGYRIMDNRKELHNGLDVAVPTGTPLYAIADGKVTAVGSGSTEGNYVYYEIDSAGTKYTVKYLHLDSVNVRRGDTIVEGQLLALSGNTGRSTGAHLHLQIEQGGKKTNPLFLVGFPQ